MPASQPHIHYRIQAINPAAHRFEIACTVTEPDPEGQRFALPAWIPGSYLIRDFSRHVLAIRAEAGETPVDIVKTDKHTWRVVPVPSGIVLKVTYEIYAWDLSVRAAHLDRTHAFFNGTSVFLRMLGHEKRPCLVNIRRPAGKEFGDWRVATALAPATVNGRTTATHAFGWYRAESYDELVDHPVEMGRFTLGRFKACGVEHEVAVTGRHDCDMERLCVDLQRICTWQIRFFGEPAPMRRYVFLVTAVGEGYGGLEHRASTALLCSRNDLPYIGMTDQPESYRNFLGLCSHEYFHTWNVKRIKPAAFTPYDLDRENYTRQLWVFEGITSYYDDLALLRSGSISLAHWLEALVKTIGNVQRAPGRTRQSLGDSSFDAWIKFYRPDENTPNAVVSYYAKGCLAALGLDLSLRRLTDGRVSLDDVMARLWQRHGQTGVGLEEDGLRRTAEEISGLHLEAFFAEVIDGTGELPLQKWLNPFGIKLVWEESKLPSFGARTSTEGKEVRLATVYDDGPAQRAGLSAGDVLVAVDGVRITAVDKFETLLERHHPGDRLAIHAFRRDELGCFSVQLGARAVESCTLNCAKRPNRLRQSWLGV